MSVVDMIHGCVPAWQPRVQSARNYVAEADLVAFLRRCARPYGAFAAVGKGAVLTVDDATVGAARACTLARDAGHAVTLFVNPAQVVSGRTYWFSMLDAILDATRSRVTVFEGDVYTLDQGPGIRALRLAVKARLMALPEADTDALLGDLARAFEVASVEVPDHARTLSMAELRALAMSGVRIGNHGGDHRDLAAMDAPAIAADIATAAAWFETALGVAPVDYAVPYGLARVPDAVAVDLPGAVFLADPRLPLGDAGARHWNRRDVTAKIRRTQC